MASEIYKKRTGKGFKITEEIVLKEEMYEEEDDLPRQYQALADHLHTSSAHGDYQLGANLAKQMTIASLAYQQEVDRIFAEEFPGIAQMSQTGSYHQRLPQPAADALLQQIRISPSPPSPSSHLSPFRDTLSAPLLTPSSGSSGSTDTTVSHPALALTQTQTTCGTPQTVAELHLHQSTLDHPPASVTSTLTAELPVETKLPAVVDTLGPNRTDLFKQPLKVETTPNHFAETAPAFEKEADSPTLGLESYFNASLQPARKHLAVPLLSSTIGTPGGGTGDTLDLWVDTDQ